MGAIPGAHCGGNGGGNKATLGSICYDLNEVKKRYDKIHAKKPHQRTKADLDWLTDKYGSIQRSLNQHLKNPCHPNRHQVNERLQQNKKRLQEMKNLHEFANKIEKKINKARYAIDSSYYKTNRAKLSQLNKYITKIDNRIKQWSSRVRMPTNFPGMAERINEIKKIKQNLLNKYKSLTQNQKYELKKNWQQALQEYKIIKNTKPNQRNETKLRNVYNKLYNIHFRFNKALPNEAEKVKTPLKNIRSMIDIHDFIELIKKDVKNARIEISRQNLRALNARLRKIDENIARKTKLGLVNMSTNYPKAAEGVQKLKQNRNTLKQKIEANKAYRKKKSSRPGLFERLGLGVCRSPSCINVR